MNNLTRLFDYQKFEHNPRLAAMIQATESRYLKKQSRQELDEDTLSMINAAGNTDLLARKKDTIGNPFTGENN